MSALMALKYTDFRAVSAVRIRRAANQMSIAAAFTTAKRLNKSLFLDDEGTFLHSPAPNPDGTRHARLQKPRNLDHGRGNREKAVQNHSRKMEPQKRARPALARNRERTRGWVQELNFSFAMRMRQVAGRLEHTAANAVPLSRGAICNTRANIGDFRRDASRKRAPQLIHASRPFWLKWRRSGNDSLNR
jgi:hypothetical protein